MHTWMIYDILLKADRMSMANSLELRVPFLDKKMLELSTRIPSRYRAANETTKIALRGAASSSCRSVPRTKEARLPCSAERLAA